MGWWECTSLAAPPLEKFQLELELEGSMCIVVVLPFFVSAKCYCHSLGAGPGSDAVPQTAVRAAIDA